MPHEQDLRRQAAQKKQGHQSAMHKQEEYSEVYRHTISYGLRVQNIIRDRLEAH